MTPERREKIREEAARLLARMELSSFFAMGLLDLRRQGGVCNCLVDTFASFCKQSGCELPSPRPCGMTLARKDGMSLILYDEMLSPERRNFTIAHEMGHLCLLHKEPSEEGEREADLFAASLLIPDVLVFAWEERNGRMDEEQMTRLFSVSMTAARRKRRDLDAVGGIKWSECERRLAAMLFSQTK